MRIQLGEGSDPVWYLYSGSAKAAPEFLSNLLTSMITMATLAISITIVVLTLAAQQLGPRLIRSFMSDRSTQIALGLFISTVVYLLLVLRTTSGATDSVPNLAVTIGTGLVIASVVTMVIFVHHLAQSIIADNVIDRVGADLDANAVSLLPKRGARAEPIPPGNIRGAGAPLCLPCGGYIQAIDHGRLVRLAHSSQAAVELDLRAGHHAIPGSVSGWILPGSALTPAFTKAVAASLLVGRDRTPVQDLEYSIRQLVEVAVRALSPGINDPFTALATIDRLALSLSRIMERGSAQRVWCDDEGHVRLIVAPSSFEGAVDAAFNQIRQRAAGMPDVLIRLADNLLQLLSVARNEHRPSRERHLRLVLRVGERSIAEPEDLLDLTSRADRVLIAREPLGAAGE
jgi:uncharacterized membrane protein